MLCLIFKNWQVYHYGDIWGTHIECVKYHTITSVMGLVNFLFICTHTADGFTEDSNVNSVEI